MRQRGEMEGSVRLVLIAGTAALAAGLLSGSCSSEPNPLNLRSIVDIRPLFCVKPEWYDEVSEDGFGMATCLVERPMWMLLDEIEKMTPQLLEHIDGDIPWCSSEEDYDYLMTHGSDFRFVPMRLVGQLERWELVSNYDSVHERERAFSSGYVMGAGDRLFRVLAPQGDLSVRVDSLRASADVNCVGIFYKIWAFQDSGSGLVRRMPVFLLCSLKD